MAHHYTTPAFILDSRPQGELHMVLTLYTKEFGLLYSVARSARTSASKLRALLQKSCIGELTLVRGKRTWKVVGVQEQVNAYYALRNEPEKLYLLARMYWLLGRLVKGQERNDRLFDLLESFSSHLMSGKCRHEDLPVLERLTALRMLSALGYATDEMALAPFLEDISITDHSLEGMRGTLALATKEINKALEATHL